MQSAVRSLLQMLAASGVPAPPRDARVLELLAPGDDEWPLVGWPPATADAAARLMNRILSTPHASAAREEPLPLFGERGEWVYVFFRGTLLDRSVADATSVVELWRSDRLSRRSGLDGPLSGSLLRYRLQAHAETHFEGGWDLHPVDSGVHLGYRMFFDPTRTQADLSWELHGRGRTPWGRPERDVLPHGRAAALHRASLAAVRAQARLAPPGRRFAQWARHFGTALSDAYVAHPAVRSPTRWHPPGSETRSSEPSSSRV